ncbi:MAG TPA: enoyl-CoA hydratase/isomerase family protein [Marmoricola sp.]|nr:enoyl-CoA hydratase/isomerase family protein [Marmoricola sp.]
MPFRLAAGSARQDGPLVLIDLSDSGDWTGSALDELDALACERAVVGISQHPLTAAAVPVLERLAFTVAPVGPGRTWVPPELIDLDALAGAVSEAPEASRTLLDVLRQVDERSPEAGVAEESLAYSALLDGSEFLTWRHRTPAGPTMADSDDDVLVRRTGATLSIVLNRPSRHNAFGRNVRDRLVDALAIAELDPSIDQVVLSGNGPSFCSGGDLDEFGTAPDPATAHRVRIDQSAGLAVHRLAERLGVRMRVRLHGACIGAGIEVPAFAGHLEAATDAYFVLPELAMGLIPGAGGTVSVSRRIGRWRTAYLALSGARIDVGTAHAWGLVDAVG